jgi:tetratricopeptide (TPR) repeat protein
VRDAIDLHQAGLAAVVARRLPAARRLLDRARDAATEPDLIARIDASRAFVMAEQGDLEGALERCDAALSRAGVASETVGVLHSQRAVILLRQGDTASALDAFGVGIGLLTDPVELGKAHINRGGVYLARGAGPRAASDFEVAVELLRRQGNEIEAAMAEHNLGYADLLQGDLVSALRHMDSVRPTLLPQGQVVVAICNQDRAEVLMAAGLVRSGLTALDEAARTFGNHHLRQRRGEAELTIARAALPSDPGRALTAARAARTRFDRERTPALRLKAEALVHGAEVRLGRTRPSLVSRGDDLAYELDARDLRWWGLDIRLDTALVVLRRGDLDEATRRLRAVRVPGTAPLAVRLRDRDVRAALAERSGRPSAALGHLRRGLGDLHEWQSSFGSLDLQTMVTGHGRRLAVRGLRVASRSRSPEVLFEWSERARMLASRVQPVRVPHDDQLAADLAELRTLAAKEEASREDAVRQAELRQRVRERAWRARGSGAYDDPMSLADFQERLVGRALVAHVVTAQRVVALVVTENRATTHDLGPREALDSLLGGLLPGLDMAAAHLPESFARSVRTEVTTRVARLDDLLLAPVAAEIGDRPLVLTPSGVLAAVPWTLLPTNRGRPVIVAESATSWAARSETPLRSGTAGFVAGPRVPQAESETSAAAKVWPGSRVLHGAEATAEAVSRMAGEVDVLHVSAHGRHSSENPLFSGFELADGPWFGYDIDQLDRVPDVVLLSACEVGRSTLRGGEELIGMTAAWLHAGARCVVASAAAINDEVAHDVLVRVHEGLAEGLRPSGALARALLDVDPEGPPAPLVTFG